MYTNPRPPYQNELYHHGILGMHWGIRRYQPYRKGEKVKGGKEIGKAAKVEQQVPKKTKTAERYDAELERIKAGGVDKNIDILIKKAKEKSENYKKDPSYQRYLADAKATNELHDALRDYMRSKGYSRYSSKEISDGIKKSKNDYNNAKKSYDDAVAKLDKMFNGSYRDNYYKKELRELYNGEQASKLRSQKYAAEGAMARAKRTIEFWEKEPMEHAMKSNNELYHHGILGMHWGVRRYQPYRKGDKVKGGKEIGKATKVEQRSIADRVRKGMAAVNKIKKELHKGKLEKAEYKYEMAQLKDAKKEVAKARRREAEERIRQRVREHREEQREEKRLEEERRDRNLERARGIAESAATIGTMLYGAYQLKKGMQDRGLLGGNQNGTNSSNPVHAGPQQTNTAATSSNPLSITRSGTNTSHTGPTHTLSNPNAPTNPNPLQIHTSGSHGPSSPTPTITTSHNSSSTSGPTHVLSPSSTVSAANTAAANSSGSTTSRGRQMVQNLLNSARTSHQANQSLSSHDRDRQQALDNNYRRSADRNAQILGLQSAISQARANADDSFNGHRSSSSQSRIDRLDALSDRANRLMNQEVRLTSNADAVANQYRQRATRSGRRQQSRDDQINAIARANGMSANQLYNASKKDKLKAFAKFLGGSGSKNSSADLNDELLGRMRDLQSSGNGARQSDIDDIRRELNRLLEHSMKSNNELYHHGVLGMHWGVRRYQPYRNGGRGIFVGVKTRKQQASFDSKRAKSLNESENFNDPKLGYEKLDDKESWLTNKKRHKRNMQINNANQDRYTKVVSPILATAGLKQDKDHPYLFTRELKDGSSVTAFASHENTPLKNISGMAKTANKYVSNKASYDKKFIDAFKKEYEKDKDRWSKGYGLDISGIKVGGVRVENDGSMMFSLYPKYGGIIDGFITADGKIKDNWGYDD